MSEDTLCKDQMSDGQMSEDALCKDQMSNDIV